MLVLTLFLMASGVWVEILTFVACILTILPVLSCKFECLVFSLLEANGWGSAGLGGGGGEFAEIE